MVPKVREPAIQVWPDRIRRALVASLVTAALSGPIALGTADWPGLVLPAIVAIAVFISVARGARTVDVLTRALSGTIAGLLSFAQSELTGWWSRARHPEAIASVVEGHTGSGLAAVALASVIDGVGRGLIPGMVFGFANWLRFDLQSGRPKYPPSMLLVTIGLIPSVAIDLLLMFLGDPKQFRGPQVEHFALLVRGGSAGVLWAHGFFVGSLGGYVLGNLLGRGGAEFAQVRPYLRAMYLPMVGFVAGYFGTVLLFAGLFASLLRIDRAAFANVSEAGFFWDFLYFSLMTITTLGYSDISPKSVPAKVLVSLEVLFGIGWTVAVFAAVLGYLGPRFSEIAATARYPTHRFEQSTPRRRLRARCRVPRTWGYHARASSRRVAAHWWSGLVSWWCAALRRRN